MTTTSHAFAADTATARSLTDAERAYLRSADAGRAATVHISLGVIGILLYLALFMLAGTGDALLDPWLRGLGVVHGPVGPYAPTPARAALELVLLAAIAGIAVYLWSVRRSGADRPGALRRAFGREPRVGPHRGVFAYDWTARRGAPHVGDVPVELPQGWADRFTEGIEVDVELTPAFADDPRPGRVRRVLTAFGGRLTVGSQHEIVRRPPAAPRPAPGTAPRPLKPGELAYLRAVLDDPKYADAHQIAGVVVIAALAIGASVLYGIAQNGPRLFILLFGLWPVGMLAVAVHGSRLALRLRLPARRLEACPHAGYLAGPLDPEPTPPTVAGVPVVFPGGWARWAADPDGGRRWVQVAVWPAVEYDPEPGTRRFALPDA